MSRTCVTQPRIASFIASFSVREPLSTTSTRAPSSFMRKTLSDWRRTSSAPMKMVHSMPSIAHTVAVATPCWPAPVSANTLRLPIRFASNPCAIALLILCAPVCARSSRLR